MSTETPNNLNPEVKRLLRLAAVEADRDQSGVITVHHILIAMAMDDLNLGASLFQQQRLTLADIRGLNFDAKPEVKP